VAFKRMRTTSPTEETGFERAKRAKIGEHGGGVSIPVSSLLNKETN
jgi:hypothetical protein